jgi:type II secretory ATPase GspE/PulE/Tfp pilus assembly ATPase PilB-like protein
MSDAVSELVAKNAPAGNIKIAALKQGMVPLRLAGFRRAAAGNTTIEEVLRVTIQDSGGAVE